MPPLRICHVNFARGFRGGERQTELLVRGLAERGLRQRLLVRADSPLRRRLAALPGLDIRALPRPVLPRAWHCRDVDLVHAHEARAVHFAHIARRLGGPPYLLTRRVVYRPGTGPVTRAAYRRATTVIAISSVIADVIRAYSPATRVVRIPSMVASMRADPRRVRDIRARFAGRRLIVCVGALVDRNKGQRVLLNALPQLDDLDVQACFVGDGPDRHALEADSAHRRNVHFAGFVGDVADWIAAADLIVQPSHDEGLGSTLLDAMQLGRPIVASRTGGIPDVVIDGESGLLVPPGDPVQLADAVRRGLTEPELAARLVDGGRRRLPAYLPARIVGLTLDLYNDLVDGMRPG